MVSTTTWFGLVPTPPFLSSCQALEQFVEGKSVVVCAPTGAGKTAIAEAAAAATIARGQRVIYTTPLKVRLERWLFAAVTCIFRLQAARAVAHSQQAALYLQFAAGSSKAARLPCPRTLCSAP